MNKYIRSLALLASAFAIAISCNKAQEPEEKTVSVTGISLNKASLSMTVGEEFTLVATITPSDAYNQAVIWSSDNDAIATVTEEGLVKALKAGKAIVTATTVDQSKSATCSIDVKEGIGAVTGEASHISCRNAVIAGKATLPQTTSTDLTFGVLYSKSSGVLIGTSTKIQAKVFDSNYNFEITTEVLEPETEYFYRSYISKNNEISYGEVKSFTTLPASSMIKTLDATDINPKDAVLNAFLDLTDCVYAQVEYGFEFTPEGGSAKVLKASNLSDNAFSIKEESLTKDSKYDFAAYVKLDGREYKSETKTLTTSSVKASVTADAQNVSYYSATISGKLSVESEGTFTKSAILYYSSNVATLDDLVSSGTKKKLTLIEDGSFSIDISSLSSNTAYNYVVVTKVDGIEFKTDVQSLKTLEIKASVTAEAKDVSYYTATISGKLSVESEGTFTKSAMLYYSNTVSTLDGLVYSGTKETVSLLEDGSFSIDLSSLSSNTAYNYIVVSKVYDVEFKSEVKSFKTQVYIITELVDLGLSVKWRGWNLGASKPEEYGGYYLWGGTTDVTSTSIYLDWYNCPYHTGSNYKTGWTKYNTISSYGTVDNKTVLDPEDDAAHVALGANWRMPTEAQWTELRENCTFTQTSNYNGTGVVGMIVTSNKSGYTDKSIFLPAAGYRLNDNLKYAGLEGYYWSSSLYPKHGTCYASNFNFDPIDFFAYEWFGYRYVGHSIRPVFYEVISVTGVSLDKSTLSLTKGDLETLTATVSPEDASNKAVTWSSSDASVATVDASGKVTAVKTGSATITVKTSDGGYTASCTVTVKEPSPSLVDLGLSVKWASCNLGASSPEEYGGYYQWAGTEDVSDKSIYLDWNNCPYHRTGSSIPTGWTKYNTLSAQGTVDNKTVLDLEDDAAHVAIGEGWRMPTDAEWTELLENCTWTWTSDYNGTGVAGRIVTSKKSGYTDKSIFLPAAGYRLNDSLDGVGVDGRYWSSSRTGVNARFADSEDFRSDSVEVGNNGTRWNGRSIRPVHE